MDTEVLGTAAPEAAPASPDVDRSAAESATAEVTENASAPAPAGLPSWMKSRLTSVTGRATRAENEAARLRARVAEFEARQAPPAGSSPQGQPAQQREPQGQQFDPAQMMEVARQQASFNIRADAVFEKGRAIEGFETSLSTLGALGIDVDAINTILDAADAPEKVLHHLGTHPDEAAEVLALGPVRMAKAIAKLEHTLTQQPAVSSAPAPLRPIRPGGGGGGPAIGTKAWFDAQNKADAERRTR